MSTDVHAEGPKNGNGREPQPGSENAPAAPGRAEQPESGAPTIEEPIESSSEPGAPATASEPTTAEPTSETVTAAAASEPTAEEAVSEPASEEPAAEIGDERPTTVEPVPAGAAPAEERPVSPDETHVAAIPPQRSDDGFDEIDGGEDAVPDPATTGAVPTSEEDDALREERARRFGRPRAGETTVDTNAEAEGAEEPTRVVPLAAAGAGAVATVGTDEAGTETRTMPSSETGADDDPFKDFDDGPTSRAAAHWWSLLIAIVFVPVGWYLIADGGERTNFNLVNGGPFNLAGPLELAGGALCLFFVLLATRWSSVGAIVVGLVAVLAGVAFLVFNEQAMELVAEYQGTLVQGLEQLGQNIVDHMLADLRTGRIAVYGFVLVMAGVISHGARRQGRREERRRAAIGA